MKKIISILLFFGLVNLAFSQCIDCPEICEGDPNPELCAYAVDPGGVTITWDNGMTGNCITPTDIAPGTYTYTATITDPAGICTPKETCFDFVINPNPEIECQLISGADVFMDCDGTFCAGTFVRANVLGELPGSTFVWTSSSGEGAPGSNPMNFNIPNPTVSTVLTVVVTTPGGCTRELTFNITIEPGPVLDCSNVTSSCGTPGNGTIMATSTVPGGTWTIDPVAGTNNTDGSFSDLPAGTYTITQVTDAGCEGSCVAVVDGSDLPDPDPTCTPQ